MHLFLKVKGEKLKEAKNSKDIVLFLKHGCLQDT